MFRSILNSGRSPFFPAHNHECLARVEGGSLVALTVRQGFDARMLFHRSCRRRIAAPAVANSWSSLSSIRPSQVGHLKLTFLNHETGLVNSRQLQVRSVVRWFMRYLHHSFKTSQSIVFLRNLSVNSACQSTNRGHCICLFSITTRDPGTSVGTLCVHHSIKLRSITGHL